jgi:hypothetical protein
MYRAYPEIPFRCVENLGRYQKNGVFRMKKPLNAFGGVSCKRALDRRETHYNSLKIRFEKMHSFRR